MRFTDYYFKVTGRVQGVGFRMFTLRHAQSLNLCGWVRNCSDGTVEGEVSGAPENLLAFFQYLDAGPPHGRVTAVETRPTPNAPRTPFEIRR